MANKYKQSTPSSRGINEDSAYYNSFNRFSAKLRSRIITLRGERDLTQEDMQQFELSLRQYQRIEKGETTNITLANLYKISKALKVTPAELLDI
ncbi:helix-turn-helix domain-containing protein [Puniceicoccaceae bacterium K14]|nr:helix-turn-helix domain-containing protein [Puniceicoccaceae bacterium K14]